MSATPTAAEREAARQAYMPNWTGDDWDAKASDRHLAVAGAFAQALADYRERFGAHMRWALADQRARYEAVAEAQEASSARWTEAVAEADNDTDRGYASGRAHAAEQAAIRIRQVAQ